MRIKALKRLLCLVLFYVSSVTFSATLELDNITSEIQLHEQVLAHDRVFLDNFDKKDLSKSDTNAMLETLSLRKKQLYFQERYLKNKIEFSQNALKNILKQDASLTSTNDKKRGRSGRYWSELLSAYRQYLDVISAQLKEIDALEMALDKNLKIKMKQEVLSESNEEIQKLNEEIAKLNQENEQILKQDASKLSHNKASLTEAFLEPYMDVRQSAISFNQLSIELVRVSKQFMLLDLQAVDTMAYSQVDKTLSELSLLQEKLLSIENSQLWLSQYQAEKKTLVSELYQSARVSQRQKDKIIKNIESLSVKLTVFAKRTSELKEQLSLANSRLTKLLKNKVKLRQGVFSADLMGTKVFVDQLLTFPNLALQYCSSLIKTIAFKFFSLSWLSFIGIFVLGLVLIILRYAALSWLEVLIETEKRAGFSFTLFDFFLQILVKNWFSVWLCLSFFIVVSFLGLSIESLKPIMGLALVWFMFRFTAALSRMLLLERVSDVSGRDVRLYHHLKHTLIIGGVISALTILAYHLTLTEAVQEFFNRLFMVFLLVASIVLYASRAVIPSILPKTVRKSRPYLSKAVGIFSSVLPLGIFVCAFIGTVGYLNLAWLLSGYLVIGLCILAAYMICRGVLVDLMNVLSEHLIRHLDNGWVISEAFLKPIDALVRVITLVFFVMLAISLYGWDSNYEFFEQLKVFLNFHLIDFATLTVTVKSLIEFLILAAFFVWLVKWTHEFCYRYLFRNVNDLGIRNSLSTFTQYSVITLGVIVTLRVLGADLSGMSYILGGLAVGMGFGLRDFASNIIGGIILLIERPLREGDVVSIDTFEGRVEHIGIRSIRMRSWDNMQVLVPNSETFNKPFTNWTHQDSVVRSVVPIKIHRTDSPTEVSQLIMEVLAIIPEVLKSPEPQVLLKNIDEVLYEFELRYYINIEQSQRMTIRSKVLFALSAQFQAAGIKAPIPSLQIEQHECDSESTESR